jgi:hypothetical protein
MTWHPIETAPRDGTAVLVYIPDAPEPHEAITTARWVGYAWSYWEPCVADHNSDRWPRLNDEPTHWMELPEAP